MIILYSEGIEFFKEDLMAIYLQIAQIFIMDMFCFVDLFIFFCAELFICSVLLEFYGNSRDFILDFYAKSENIHSYYGDFQLSPFCTIVKCATVREFSIDNFHKNEIMSRYLGNFLLISVYN